jgi:hypothetical protein
MFGDGEWEAERLIRARYDERNRLLQSERARDWRNAILEFSEFFGGHQERRTPKMTGFGVFVNRGLANPKSEAVFEALINLECD